MLISLDHQGFIYQSDGEEDKTSPILQDYLLKLMCILSGFLLYISNGLHSWSHNWQYWIWRTILNNLSNQNEIDLVTWMRWSFRMVFLRFSVQPVSECVMWMCSPGPSSGHDHGLACWSVLLMVQWTHSFWDSPCVLSLNCLVVIPAYKNICFHVLINELALLYIHRFSNKK